MFSLFKKQDDGSFKEVKTESPKMITYKSRVELLDDFYCRAEGIVIGYKIDVIDHGPLYEKESTHIFSVKLDDGTIVNAFRGDLELVD